MRILLFFFMVVLCLLGGTAESEQQGRSSKEQLEVAEFWKNMGPTLREQGIEAYAIRYHDDFRHWDITGSGRMGTKDSAIKAWTRFHEEGHRITCSFVRPISVDINADLAFARLEYEQTDTYADGRERTSVWRLFDVFKRFGDTWQVLESNMVEITPEPSEDSTYEFHCPKS